MRFSFVARNDILKEKCLRYRPDGQCFKIDGHHNITLHTQTKIFGGDDLILAIILSIYSMYDIFYDAWVFSVSKLI